MIDKYTSPSGKTVRWANLIRDAMRLPNQWMLALPDTSVSTLNTIRKRRVASLRRADGRLYVEERNTYDTPEGQQHCDCYVRWVPATAPLPKEG